MVNNAGIRLEKNFEGSKVRSTFVDSNLGQIGL